jgi:hypothetical protein
MTMRLRLLLILACGLTAAATLAAAASEIAGKWDFVFQTPAGERKSPLEMTVEGTQVTAKMGEVVLRGSYQDEKLELKGNVYSSEAGYTGELRITGKLEKDQISGTAVWDTYQMTFTATRSQ